MHVQGNKEGKEKIQKEEIQTAREISVNSNNHVVFSY